MAKVRTRVASESAGAGLAPGKTAGEIETQANKLANHSAAGVVVSSEERRLLVSRAAYLRAEARGFAPGGDVDDWLQAELEVDASIAAASATGS